METPKKPEVITISLDSVSFPILTADGFGKVVVDGLRPGEERWVMVNGRTVIVRREQVH